MKVKNVTIGIKSIEEVLNGAKSVMKRLERGDKVRKRRPGIYFESLEIMRKAITPERVKNTKGHQGKASRIYL